MENKTVNKELIEELTQEQLEKIPEYIERFRAIGTSTEPIDKEKAKRAIIRSYNYLAENGTEGFSKNPEVIFVDSPIQGAVLAAQFAKGSKNVTQAEVQEQAGTASYGSFEAYWVSVYAFIAEQLPVEKNELIDIALDIVENCGVYWTFEDLAIVSDRPSSIKTKDNKLHATDGPAMEFRDGKGIYALNGESKKSLMDVVLSQKTST